MPLKEPEFEFMMGCGANEPPSIGIRRAGSQEARLSIATTNPVTAAFLRRIVDLLNRHGEKDPPAKEKPADQFFILYRAAKESYAWRVLMDNGALKLCGREEVQLFYHIHGTENVRVLRKALDIEPITALREVP